MNVLHDIRFAVRLLSKDRGPLLVPHGDDGSTRSARRAGIAQPSAPAAISRSATLAKVSGSAGVTPTNIASRTRVTPGRRQAHTQS
jgi:hypothetical protein